MDTDPESLRAQRACWARMGPARRVELAFEMSEAAREIAAQGIRRRHPEYSEAEIRRALAHLLLGVQLARAAWPERDSDPA